MANTHFVLLHTICHGAWIWYKLKPLLEAAGHKVTALDLAASGIDPRQIEQVGSFEQYSEPLLKLMKSIPEGEKVILVGESCAGINIAIAADKYPKKIAAAVFHNALMPDTDHKPSHVVDKFLETFPDWKDSVYSTYNVGDQTVTAMKLGHHLIENFIYNKSSVEDQELGKILTRKGSLFQEDLVNRKNFTKEGYGSIKRVYVYGEEDKIFSREFHVWQIENYKPDMVYGVPDGDHKLMLSKVKEFFKILQEVADEYASYIDMRI